MAAPRPLRRSTPVSEQYIRIEQVCKWYATRRGKRRVLDHVEFKLRKGAHLGILGRNGAGKSTLIRLLSGAEMPTSGRIHRHMSISWPLAFTGAFQQHLTGIDNLKFICRIYGLDWKPLLPFIEEFTELGMYLREPVMNYSVGMTMRLAFALSMAVEFDCFLIDEGMAVGDSRFGDRCHVELFQKRADRSFVLVSHDPRIIRSYCERVAVLDRGRLLEFDSVDEAYAFYDASALPAPSVRFD
jgi:capsular polysaccharide transport system ATP-binding protein